MHKDMYSALCAERRRDLLAEVERNRLAGKLPGRRLTLGRRAAGRLGSMMIAAGSHLKQIEQGGRQVVYDV